MSSANFELFVKAHPILITVLEGLHEMAMILNEKREIIYFNEKFSEFAKAHELNPKAGILPGNAMNCVHALKGDRLCGTTDFCKYCGANDAIIQSIAGDQASSYCHITAVNGNAFDLKVNATPLQMGNEYYTLYCVTDVSAELRKNMLEKIFFHDINNIVSGISLMTDLMSEKCDAIDEEDKGNLTLMVNAVESLKSEIKAQHIITMAEKDELQVSPVMVNIYDMLEHTLRFFKKSSHNKNIKTHIEADDKDASIYTDQVLIKRVVSNMIKNAFEASRGEQTISAGYELGSESIIIWVHNEAVMNDEVSRSIFKRSFSTKGTGRGLGTYSMRLLTERYLQGSIYFSSEEGEGTRFYIELPISLQR